MTTAASSNKTPFKTAYGPKSSNGITFPKTGRTMQAQQSECDINNIMAKFQRTGLIDFVNANQPKYGDVTGLDFETAVNNVAKTREWFAQLPAKWRSRFDNDPGLFLDFINDPENRPEAIQLGLIEEAPPAAAADPVDEPGATSAATATT